MKKVVLVCLAVATGLTTFSQGRLARPDLFKIPAFYGRSLSEAEESKTEQNITPFATEKRTYSTNSIQSVLTLGTSANANTAVGIRNYLWADPILNTVLFVRRAVGGITGPINGGRLYYDISFNGGASFDTGRGPVYTPSLSTVINPSNARYPQAAIYNPTGSTNPMDAYMTYYAASLNNTNPSGTTNWGGNVYGSYKLNLATPPTQHELVSDSIAGAWYAIPELMHMCKNGTTYVLSQSEYGNSDLIGRGVAFDYTGTMILEKGIWDTVANDYNYSRQLIAIPSGQVPYDLWYYHAYSGSNNPDPVNTMLNAGIVFGDNGQTGYMVFKEFLNTTDSPDTTVQLYIYKTSNGGATWSPTQRLVFDEIDKLCQDSGFAMGLAGDVLTDDDFDLAMDANNNLHIVIVVGSKYMDPRPAIGTTVYYQENYGSLFDLFTTNGGTSWFAHKLMSNPIQEIYGVMGDPMVSAIRLVYDNRPQITRSWDGTKLFFSWFETDTTAWLPVMANVGYNNQNPDMHVVGYDVTTGMWTPEYNATLAPALGGDADGGCYLGSVAYYALNNGSGGYKIPTVIGTPSAFSTNNNPDYQNTFQFKYLDGVVIPSGAYTIPDVLYGSGPNPSLVMLNYQLLSTQSIKMENDFIVSPVRPNPVFGRSELLVQISKPGDVQVAIRNLLGQEVYSTHYLKQPGGLHQYYIEKESLDAGLYLCIITYDNKQVTQKISVQ